MLNVVYIAVTIFILIVGYLYMNAVHKINKADIAAKDAGSDIDTCLWDLNHNVSVVYKALQEKGVELELPEDQSSLLGLGMTPTVQQLVAKNAEERMNIVRPEAEKAALAEDEAVAKAFTKFDNARNELIAAGLKYNKLAGRFNSVISGFPASMIADHKHKSAKQIFIYQPPAQAASEEDGTVV